MSHDKNAVGEASAAIAEILTKLERATGRPVLGVDLSSVAHRPLDLRGSMVVDRVVAIELGARTGDNWRA